MSILSASVPNSRKIFSSNSSTMPSHWNYKIWTQSMFIEVSQVVCKIYIHALYRVIHKSVKHFKNSQQINYSKDYGSSYADRERNSPSFFCLFHRCSVCPPLVIRQTSMWQSISFHTHVSISRSTRASAAVIRLPKSGDQRGVEAQRQCPSQTPRRKSQTGLNPGTGVATALMCHLLFLCVLSTSGKFRLRYPCTSLQ